MKGKNTYFFLQLLNFAIEQKKKKRKNVSEIAIATASFVITEAHLRVESKIARRCQESESSGRDIKNLTAFIACTLDAAMLRLIALIER